MIQTLPEAQRTQKLTPRLRKFANNIAELAWFTNLATRWRHLYKFQFWPPDIKIHLDGSWKYGSRINKLTNCMSHFAWNPERSIAKPWCKTHTQCNLRCFFPSGSYTFRICFALYCYILVLVHTTQCGSLLLLRFFCGKFPSGPDSPWAAQFTPKWLSWVTEQSCMMITIPMSTLLLLHTEYDEVSPKSIQLLEYAIPLFSALFSFSVTKNPDHFSSYCIS